MIMWPHVLLALHSPHVNFCVLVYEFVCVPLCLQIHSHSQRQEGESKSMLHCSCFELEEHLQGGGLVNNRKKGGDCCGHLWSFRQTQKEPYTVPQGHPPPAPQLHWLICCLA